MNGALRNWPKCSCITPYNPCNYLRGRKGYELKSQSAIKQALATVGTIIVM